MSTVRLKQSYQGHPKGAEISVPFGKGKELLKLGIAEYAAGPAKAAAPSAPAVPMVPKSELDAALARVAELEAVLADVPAPDAPKGGKK